MLWSRDVGIGKCRPRLKRQLANVVVFTSFLMGLYIMVEVDLALRFESARSKDLPEVNPTLSSTLQIRASLDEPGSRNYSFAQNVSKEPEKRNKRYMETMDKTCIEHGQPRMFELLYLPPIKSHMLKVQPKQNLYFCPVQKAGSAYWLRVLDIIGIGGHDPYAKDLNDIKKTFPFVENWEKGIPKDELLKRLSSRFAFLVVRDPYARLFSAYVDKIFYPNPDYWPKLTRDIARVVGRPNSTGHDITFAETVKYLIMMDTEKPDDIDMHFQTVTRLCNPCGIYYDFVGKFETFKQDNPYVLKYISDKHPEVDFDFDNTEAENRIDDMRRRTNALFNTMTSYKFPKVMSKYVIFKRAWRNLIIRGYIPNGSRLPVTQSQAPKMDETTFGTILINAIKVNVRTDAVRNQQEKALLQAYRSVPYADMLKLRKMLLQDCQLFDYDDMPSELFDKKARQIKADEYDYFKMV